MKFDRSRSICLVLRMCPSDRADHSAVYDPSEAWPRVGRAVPDGGHRPPYQGLYNAQ